MTIRDNGAGKPYYTQRNNRLSPGAACSVTAMIAALSAAGWDVDGMVAAGWQPEDALMQFIRTDSQVLAKYDAIDPKHTCPPNEWHPVLSFATDLWLKRLTGRSGIVEWGTHRTIRDFARAIDEGGAVVTSGIFRDHKGKSLHHVVAVVGYYGNADSPTGVILDDSWGNYKDGYLTQRGKGIWMPKDDFAAMINYTGGQLKIGHIVRRFR